MSKQAPIRINTSTNKARDYADRAYKTDSRQSIGQELSVVNGDVLTILADFREELNDGSEVSMNLTGALALRATLSDSRQTAPIIFSVQDSYNQGDVPSNEDLAQGLVTWNLYADPANIDTPLGSNPFLDAWLDFSWITAEALPQTLAQIPIRIYPQIDSSLVGSPPPSEPDYLTAVDSLATFVQLANYIAPSEVTVDGPVTPIDGIQTFFVDPAGGTLTINLPALASTPDNFIGRFIIVGTGTMRLTPDGLETINDQAGPSDFPTQYTEVILLKRAGGWVNPMLVTT